MQNAEAFPSRSQDREQCFRNKGILTVVALDFAAPSFVPFFLFDIPSPSYRQPIFIIISGSSSSLRFHFPLYDYAQAQPSYLPSQSSGITTPITDPLRLERECYHRRRMYERALQEEVTRSATRRMGEEKLERLRYAQREAEARLSETQFRQTQASKARAETLRRTRSEEELRKFRSTPSPSPSPPPPIHEFHNWPKLLLMRLEQPILQPARNKRDFRFADIPWPIFKTFTSPVTLAERDITPLAVSRFLLEAQRHAEDGIVQKLIKVLLLRFHTDKSRLLIGSVTPDETEQVQRASKIVLQGVLEFKERHG
ncbi:hypothetical protein BT69DRAFT_1319596 [Atractiella rhizophila]|nr:hypothetical protein BT69DRAFT_1319596 [Atractiella rhizophila]